MNMNPAAARELSAGALAQIAAQYGTPTYVFDTQALQERVRAVRSLFGDNISLCYSIKANPFLIPAMMEVTDHLEVCSPGELEICENLFEAGNEAGRAENYRRIVYSGVCKTLDDIREAVRVDVGICTAESIPQLKLLEQAAGEAGRTIPVLLRLNSGSQFGMSREDLFAVLENLREYPHMSVEGLHYFVGTQRKKLDRQREELDMLRSLFEEIRSTFGIPLRRLEYGPGLYVPLFEGEDFADTLAPAAQIADALKEAAGWSELTVEMGRFFTTQCGYYLTRVMEQKSVSTKHYALVDGGINHVAYAGQIMGMKQPVIRRIPADTMTVKLDEVNTDMAGVASKECGSGKNACAPAMDWAICGSLCTTNDMLVREIHMPELTTGDLLVFENIGAYSVTEGIYLFLSRAMPKIVLYNSAGTVLARDTVRTSRINTIDIDLDKLY